MGKLINLDVSESEIREILVEAGFTGYRFVGALAWITGSLAILRELNRR